MFSHKLRSLGKAKECPADDDAASCISSSVPAGAFVTRCAMCRCKNVGPNPFKHLSSFRDEPYRPWGAGDIYNPKSDKCRACIGFWSVRLA
jgi:hypothetical protein